MEKKTYTVNATLRIRADDSGEAWKRVNHWLQNYLPDWIDIDSIDHPNEIQEPK